MNADAKRRLERLEDWVGAADGACRGWQRVITNEGDPLPPDLDPSKGLIVRVIIDSKPPQEVLT